MEKKTRQREDIIQRNKNDMAEFILQMKKGSILLYFFRNVSIRLSVKFAIPSNIKKVKEDNSMQQGESNSASHVGAVVEDRVGSHKIIHIQPATPTEDSDTACSSSELSLSSVETTEDPAIHSGTSDAAYVNDNDQVVAVDTQKENLDSSTPFNSENKTTRQQYGDEGVEDEDGIVPQDKPWDCSTLGGNGISVEALSFSRQRNSTPH